jgi:trehalose 6-phosphate synthase
MGSTNNLVVLSNRGPISFGRDAAGTIQIKRGGGGLVVTLGPGVERDGALWLAAATSEVELEAAARGMATHGQLRFQAVPVLPADYSAYYDVVSNQTLWFCLHGLWDLPRRPRFDRHWWAAWERFEAVNEAFATAADDAADTGATVLIHDYHLALVPRMLAERRPDLKTTTFLHTPWCSPEELAVLPDEVAHAVLAGLAGGGPVGFHCQRWAASFEACCRRVLGHPVETYLAPAATDLDDIRTVAASARCAEELAQLEEEVGDRRLIVRVDRIELSKNVLRGFWAYDELLETRPDLRGSVVFAAKVYPSRLGLAEYQAYGAEVQALANRINSKWAKPGWTPILIDTEDNYPRSVAALRRFDVLLVNPVRDGLNLVAKEGPLVNERDGVVVLSREAGCWDEIGQDVIGINPFDVSSTAAALARALDMPAAERTSRATATRAAAALRSPLDWFDDQLAAAAR